MCIYVYMYIYIYLVQACVQLEQLCKRDFSSVQWLPQTNWFSFDQCYLSLSLPPWNTNPFVYLFVFDLLSPCCCCNSTMYSNVFAHLANYFFFLSNRQQEEQEARRRWHMRTLIEAIEARRHLQKNIKYLKLFWEHCFIELDQMFWPFNIDLIG